MTEWVSNSSKVRREPPRGEKTLLYILLNMLSATKWNNFVFNIPEVVKEGQTVKYPDIQLNEAKLFGCYHSPTSPFLRFSLLFYFSTLKNIRVFLNWCTAGSTKLSYFFCIRFYVLPRQTVFPWVFFCLFRFLFCFWPPKGMKGSSCNGSTES